VCGNALSLKKVQKNGSDTNDPIVFSEWTVIEGFKLHRSDYTFCKLLEGEVEGRDIFERMQKNTNNKEAVQLTLLNGLEKFNEQPDDEGEFLRDYTKHYRRIWENGE
jgi:hypothetical protein